MAPVSCCPGGFSAHILQKDSTASGVGISLPTKQGGYELALKGPLKTRFRFHEVDITHFKLGGGEIEYQSNDVSLVNQFVDLPGDVLADKRFDLVILGATVLYTTTSDNRCDIDRLLISQLIIGLQFVRSGGTLMVLLTHLERIMTAKVLYMLETISTQLSTWKPRRMHSKKPTFYAVAKGVGRGRPQTESLDEMLGQLKKLWYRLTLFGRRNLSLSDLDFVISTEDIRQGKNGFLDRLVTQGKQVWEVELRGLRDAMEHERGQGNV